MTRNQTVDTLLQLSDAGLIAASAYTLVDSVAAEIDVGAHAIAGNVAVDVTAIEIASDDELYTLTVLGSNTSGYATGAIVPLASIELGAGAAMTGVADLDTVVGRYIIPFRNEKDGTVYRYIRLYITIAGTIATGINFVSYMHKGLMQSAP